MEERSKADDSSSKKTKTKPKGKKFTKLVVLPVILALLVGGAYWIGQRKSNASTEKKASNLTNSSSPFSRTNGSTSTSRSGTNSTNSKSSSNTVHRLPPSNGHISLSGTVTDVNDQQISIKTTNGDTKTFSIDKTTRVYTNGKAATNSKPTDIKTGTQANIIVLITTDGSFNVQMIRTY